MRDPERAGTGSANPYEADHSWRLLSAEVEAHQGKLSSLVCVHECLREALVHASTGPDTQVRLVKTERRGLRVIGIEDAHPAEPLLLFGGFAQALVQSDHVGRKTRQA